MTDTNHTLTTTRTADEARIHDDDTSEPHASDTPTVTLESLQQALEDEREKSSDLAVAAGEARVTQLKAERFVGRLRDYAAIDRRAREGQVRRARRVEHELREVEHDRLLQGRLREEAELKTKALDATLQRERAARLREMHVNRSLHDDKDRAVQGERKLRGAFVRQSARCDKLESDVARLEDRVGGQEKIIKESDYDLCDNATELEKLRLDNLRLQAQVERKHRENQHHCKMRMEADKECETLRTKLMLLSAASKDPRSQHDRALLVRENSKLKHSVTTTSLAMERQALAGITRANLRNKVLSTGRGGNTSSSRTQRSKMAGRIYYESIAPSYAKELFTSSGTQSSLMVDDDENKDKELSLADVAWSSCLYKE